MNRTELVSCLARSKRLSRGYQGLLSISRARRDLGEDGESGMAKRNLNVGAEKACSVDVAAVADLTTPVQAKRSNVEGSTLDRMRAHLRTSRVVRVMSAMGLQVMVSTSTCSFESESRQRRAEEKEMGVSSSGEDGGGFENAAILGDGGCSVFSGCVTDTFRSHDEFDLRWPFFLLVQLFVNE